MPVTFRAAGTSLSGQAVSDSVLVRIGKGWRNWRVGENAERITLQPGIIGSGANKILAEFGKKIGPDPASIDSCFIGGIFANNASGMLVEQQQCAGCVPQHQIGQRHLPKVGKLPNAQGLAFLRGRENVSTVLVRRICSLIRDRIRSLVRIGRGGFRKA